MCVCEGVLCGCVEECQCVWGVVLYGGCRRVSICVCVWGGGRGLVWGV